MSWITYEIDVDVVKKGISVGTLETELSVEDGANVKEWNGLEIADSLFEEYNLSDKYPTLTDLELTLNELIVDRDIEDVVKNGLTITI